MKTISRHPVLYSPLSKADKTQLLHSCFRVHLSTSHICPFTKGSKVLEVNNLKLHMTWNVIRNCKPTKTEHIQQKNDNQLPTWTTIYWLKQRQSITSHPPP